MKNLVILRCEPALNAPQYQHQSQTVLTSAVAPGNDILITELSKRPISNVSEEILFVNVRGIKMCIDGFGDSEEFGVRFADELETNWESINSATRQ